MTITVARQAPSLPVGLKLVFVIALAAGIAGWLEPRLFRDPAGVIAPLIERLQLARAVTQLPELHGDIMAIERGADGALWVASKYEVVRYPAAAVDQGRRVLDSETFRALFRRRMDALSTLHVAASGIWVGSWYGQVLRYRSGTWTRVSDRETGPGGRINAIVEAGGVLYVGGDGLWAWSRAHDALRKVEDLPEQPVTALARSAHGALLVGTRGGVLVKRGGRWQTLWRARAGDVEVNALYVTRDGELLVATHDGYLVIDGGGQVLLRELGGSWVTGFSELPGGELWVATWKSGVRVRRHGAWRTLGHARGLAGDSVAAVAVDAHRRLWLGIYGHGVSVAEAARLADFSVEDGARRSITGATAFADACAAATAVLGAGGESGAVAIDTVAGRSAVFFNGRQVCPAGLGYRRDADTLVTIDDTTVRYRHAGSERLLPLPARAVGAVARAVFVDSRGRLWLGFRNRGVFVFRDGSWQAFGKSAGLIGNPVQAITEDASGAIWIATHPPFDAQAGRYRHAGVHRYDGKRWTHFGLGRRDPTQPAESAFRGLPGASANTVRVLSDGRVAIGTNGGLAIYENGAFSSYTRSALQGLTSSFVEDVVEDPDGRLWLTHALWGHGVTWKSGFLFHQRSTRDGLLHDRIDHLAFDSLGNVWMQSSQGETAIYPLESLVD
jgi:ligand-binding sensor domain-containing protein